MLKEEGIEEIWPMENLTITIIWPFKQFQLMTNIHDTIAQVFQKATNSMTYPKTGYGSGL